MWGGQGTCLLQSVIRDINFVIGFLLKEVLVLVRIENALNFTWEACISHSNTVIVSLWQDLPLPPELKLSSGKDFKI